MTYEILSNYLTEQQLNDLTKILSHNRLIQIQEFCKTREVVSLQPDIIMCANTIRPLLAGIQVNVREPEYDNISYSFREDNCIINKISHQRKSTMIVEIGDKLRIRSVSENMNVNAINMAEIVNYFVNPTIDFEKAQNKLVLEEV